MQRVGVRVAQAGVGRGGESLVGGVAQHGDAGAGGQAVEVSGERRVGRGIVHQHDPGVCREVAPEPGQARHQVRHPTMERDHHVDRPTRREGAPGGGGNGGIGQRLHSPGRRAGRRGAVQRILGREP